MRLIDADALEYDCNADECGMLTGCNHCQYHVITEDEIDNAPTIEERPKGEWYYNYQNGWHCSICNKSVKDMPTVMGKANFNFCPNCGADMRGEEE